MQADGLPYAPFDTIPHHGLAESARNGETDVGTGGFGLPHAERRKEGTRET
jgi:hypothetical protein